MHAWQIIGEGYHPEAGKPHAEVYALRAAGRAAHGATAYVTLEPCNHFGRTPPCSRALVAAQVSRVSFVPIMRTQTPQSRCQRCPASSPEQWHSIEASAALCRAATLRVPTHTMMPATVTYTSPRYFPTAGGHRYRRPKPSGRR